MDYQQVREKLVRAAEMAVGVELQGYEQSRLEQVGESLCGRLMAATDHAVDAASETLQYYEDRQINSVRKPAAAGSNIQGDADDMDDMPRNSMRVYQTIDSLSSGGADCQQVIDLAWIGRLTLRNKRFMLEEARALSDLWLVLSHCWSAKRMVVKTTTAIERAASNVEGVPSRLIHLYATETDKGLRARRLYVRFKRHMQPEVPPQPSEIRIRLRSSGVALAKVFGDEAYGDLRIQDRQMLTKIQNDILQWFREYPGEVSSAGVRQGMRLWQEAAVFSQCLMMVNNRPELREHDKELAEFLLGDIEMRGFETVVHDPEWHRRIRLLQGRDDELDRLLHLDGPPDRMIWIEMLERIRSL